MGLTNDREPGGDGFAKLQEQQVALAVRDSELLREQGVLQGKIDAVQRRLDLCDGVALQAVGARDSLRSWLRVVESSAVGGLARRVHDGYRSTGAQASRAFERATTLPGINFEEPRNARNSFVRSVTRTLIFTVVAVTLGLQFFDDLAEWSAQYFWDRTTNLALLWGLLILGIVLFLVRVLRNHFKRHLRFRRAAAMAQHELDEAEREFSQSKRVEQRFDSLRPQLADWTRILGYVVHNPWRTDPQTSAQPGLVLHAPLPNTVEIAEPDTSDLATERSMAAVALRSLAGSAGAAGRTVKSSAAWRWRSRRVTRRPTRSPRRGI